MENTYPDVFAIVKKVSKKKRVIVYRRNNLSIQDFRCKPDTGYFYS
jgi:hypothetical protein